MQFSTPRKSNPGNVLLTSRNPQNYFYQWYFQILPKKLFFQNIKIKLNSRIWMTMKSSVVIFQALEPPWPQWPWQSHFITKITDPDGLIIPGTQMINAILVPSSGMDHQKSKFSLVSAPFLLEAVEASWCYFFENWLMKLKCTNLLKPLGTIIH